MTIRDPAALRFSACVALSIVLLVSPLGDLQVINQYISTSVELSA